METNIFAEVKSEYPFLNRVERVIADAVLGAPQKFINLSITKLAQKIKVSQGSINNFAKKFSGGGFSALKLKLAKELSSHSTQIVQNGEINNIKSAMENRISQLCAAYNTTLEVNSEQSLKNAVNLLLKAKKIEIYGVFTSSIVAKTFSYQLIQLGLPATFESDSLMCAVSASMLDSESLVIAVSSSGKTKEVIDAVKVAKAHNASVITITCNKSSPLAKISDEILVATATAENISDRDHEIIATQLLIIDALCSYIENKTEQPNQKQSDELQNIRDSHSIND